MSYTPTAPIERAAPIEIKFDRPVVYQQQVGAAIDPRSASLTAKISAANGIPLAWRGRWKDHQTLSIEPSAPLAPSTRYHVELAGDLARRTAGFHFELVNRPLAVEGLWGVNINELPPDAALPMSFNQPVRPADVVAHCKLNELALDGKHPDLALRTTATEPATSVPVMTAVPLEAGAEYTLSCTGLAGAGGDVPLDKPYRLTVRARPAMTVTEFSPSGEGVSADQATLIFNFATPVELDAARKAISSQPAIPGLADGYLSNDNKAYQITVDLETQTKYQLTVADLVDTYGQKLAAPAHYTFKTGDAQPRLSMQRGIFAVEASARGLPVWSRNIDKYSVECAQIPSSKLVQLLTTDMNYDAWGGNDDDKPLGWASLGVKPRTAVRSQTTRNTWLLDEIDLGAACGAGAGRRGVYLAEVSSDQAVLDQGAWAPRHNRVLANVTDLGILLEVGTSSGVVWVTSLATGEPVGGASVKIFTPAGKQVFADATDADGLLKIPSSAILKAQRPRGADPEADHDWDNYRSQRLIAVVERAGDTAVVDGNWSNGIQTWNFGVREDRSGGTSWIRGFVQSDRGLYRPGETVHFKGIAREIAQGRAPRIPLTAGGSKAPVAIEVTDSRNQVVLTTRRTLSGFGGFAFDLALGDEASLGDYYVAATIAGQTFRERFSVEELRPATFELGLRGTAAHPRPGDRLGFELDARYLFGAPLTAAKVEWTLRKRTHVVQFDGWDDYTFDNTQRWWWGRRESDDYGQQISDGTGATDAQGKLTIEARDDATTGDTPVDYILSSTVTDSTDQTMSKSVVVAAHRTQFYLGVHANEFVQAVGMPFGVNLVALDPDGKRVATRAHLSFVRTVNHCTWITAHGRATPQCDAKPDVAIERDVDLAAGGSHTERIYPTAPGEYAIKVTAHDANGSEVSTSSEIWVIGKGEAFWSGDEGARMTVVTGKASYQPGETAKLVAQANLVKPTALITIERDGVIDAQIKRLGSASEGVELTIADAWAPNVFARVSMVAGRHGAGDVNRPQFKMGLVELNVASSHKQLDVQIALDRDRVRPGDKVTGKIVVRHDGQPVTAEVSLSAADEGILQLIAYQTPNPMKTFYAPYGLGVDAGTNWNRVARIADPTSGDPDQGGDSASSNDTQRVRSKFVASAYWAPMLVTDEHGEIAFSFTAPDNLTAFRLMAVAADAGDQFGAGERRLTIDKPLMATPALPRFLRGGDAATVGVVVHNHTEHGGRATVTAKATGATLDAASQVVDVPAHGSTRVRFAARASDAASASFEFAVALGGERDALRVSVPIDRPRQIDHRVLVDRPLAGHETWTGALDTTSDVLRDDSSLMITIDTSGVGDLAPALRGLIEYPYGCLEQTMSRFIPLVAAKDLARTLDDPSLQGTQANQFINAGIAKVIRHQQGDGLFSLWPQSQTYPHLAAYALWGLTVAEQAGEQVPRDVFDRGIPALDKWASTTPMKPDGDAATMAMAAYVMALRGKPDAALAARLYEIRTALPRWGQAFLLRALAAGKADRAQVTELEQLIASETRVVGGVASVHESTPGYEYELYMTSDVRATAMTLAALLEVDPGSALIEPLVAGLKASRDQVGGWHSTQENLWSLVALAAYGRRSAHADVTAQVTAGGKTITRRLAGQPSWTFRARLADLAGDHLEVTSDRPAHLIARVSEARVDPGAAVANGFTLTRRYLDEHGQPITAFTAGQLVTVQLDVSAAAPHHWVAMVDPLPAGFEAQNPKLASGGAADPKPAATSAWGTALTWSHQDLRDDRVQWFADDMPAGSYQLSYTARATIDGQFTVMPATVEAMYQPELRARTARSVITIAR